MINTSIQYILKITIGRWYWMSSEMRATVEGDILLKHQNNSKRKIYVNALCVAAAETADHEESIQTRRICFFSTLFWQHIVIYITLYTVYMLIACAYQWITWCCTLINIYSDEQFFFCVRFVLIIFRAERSRSLETCLCVWQSS